MRVLLVSQEYPPETAWGGIGTYAGTLAPALAAQGAEVHVLSASETAPPGDAERDGVHVHRRALWLNRWPGRIAGLPQTWLRARLAATVAGHARDLGPFEVCEAPDWGAEAGLIGRRIPVVLRLHSGLAQVAPFTGPGGIDERLAARAEHAVARRAAQVVASPAQARHAAAALGVPADRLRVVPYPVAPLDAGAAPAEPHVLFLGRLEPRKGPMTLLEALPALADRVPDVRLTLAGVDTGGARSHRAELERRARELGVAGRVRIDERWGADVVREHLASALVVALPSRWESFGYTAAEAMAAGRALVAADIPAFADLVADGVTGLLADPADPGAWASAISRLLIDPHAARALGEGARARIAARHDPAQVAAAMLDVYAEAAGG